MFGQGYWNPEAIIAHLRGPIGLRLRCNARGLPKPCSNGFSNYMKRKLSLMLKIFMMTFGQSDIGNHRYRNKISLKRFSCLQFDFSRYYLLLMTIEPQVSITLQLVLRFDQKDMCRRTLSQRWLFHGPFHFYIGSEVSD